jgi:hypothetical protein
MWKMWKSACVAWNIRYAYRNRRLFKDKKIANHS